MMLKDSRMADRLAGLIHAGKIHAEDGSLKLVFLRRLAPHQFSWFIEENQKDERETEVSGPTTAEAIRLANVCWKKDHFTSLGCGFRYMLPERDEHGINALFHQMVASYNSMTGVYFDEELGNNCFVQNASIEARNVWKRLINHDKTV
jgi:hypothetical protein